MIITVSREFGSGGRELGKRLSDALGLEYYDKQLVTQIAKNTELDANYVASVLENGGFQNYPLSYAKTLPPVSSTPAAITDVLVAQQKVIEAIAQKGDCVIVGRSADVILHEYNPVNIFVYASTASKIKRCREREQDGENLTDKQLIKSFKRIDKGRAKLHDVLSSTAWGDKDGYDILVNTSFIDIKDIIAPLADLVTEIAAAKTKKG